MVIRSVFSRNSHSSFPTAGHGRSWLLHSDIPRHLNELRVYREAIYESPLIDERSSFTLPIECDDVLDHLESIDQCLSKIRETIQAIHEGEHKVLPSPYKLLMYLYAADDDLRSAMYSVEQFRPVCASRTARFKRGQMKVQGELCAVLRTCEKIETEAGSMLDELLLHSP